MRKLLALFAVFLALAVLAYAQEPQRFLSGIEIVRGNLNVGSGSIVFEGSTGDANELTLTVADPGSDVTVTVPATTDTLVNLTDSQTLTNKTFTSPTLNTPTVVTPTITAGTIGRGVSRISYRQDFDEPCFVREAADFTAELATDAAVNLALCAGSPGVYEFRIDGAQASPFLVKGGILDIDNDAANNEGVEIVLAETSNATMGWSEVGTSPEMYFRAAITIGSVSGTDNMYMGWKIAGAFVDDLVLETIDTGGFFHINDNAGNIEIQTADDTVDADDEADANATWTDGEEIVLEVRLLTDGTFEFYQDDVQVTQTTATGAAAAGDVMVPVIGLLQDSDADTELTIDYIEIGQVP